MMTEPTDHELLTQFARTGAESAFAALVTRHVNLVYSAALRFTGNTHQAEEITQAVFIILARKAGGISAKVILTGWLYNATQLTASKAFRENFRRQWREHQSYMDSTLNQADADAAWQQLAPVLDEAMSALRTADRDAVLLRFFENKPLAEVGAALGVSEDAARVRVNRALEKLRLLLSKQGVVLGAMVIGSAMTANSVNAAPVVLTKTITAIAAAKGVTATASSLALVKGTLNVMAWAKAKTAFVVSSLLVLVGVGTSTVVVCHLPPQEPAYFSQLKKEGGMVSRAVLYPTHGRHKSQLNLWFVTEASFTTLTNAQEIEDLEIVGSDLRTPAFNLISNLTNLKGLSLLNCKILPAQLAAIQNLTNLENLKVDFSPALFNGSQVDKVKLLGELSPEETTTVAMLKSSRDSKKYGVHDNVLQATLLDDRAMPYLSRLTKLKTLDLSRAYISANGLKQLTALTNLEEVDMSPMGLNQETAMPFQAMTKLRSLEYFNVDDGVIGTLSKITALERVNLWSGDVTDASTNYFTSLTNLNHLEIRGNKMTDDGLLQLALLPKLKYLDVQSAEKITANGIAQFHKLRPEVEILY